MNYQGKEFDAVVATPGCGKSYLCDKYPDKFVDVDEVRLKCKYFIPENISREELESTKGNRPYEKRAHYHEYIAKINTLLDQYVAEGKTLIAAPHPESIDYLVDRGIRFAFVYQGEDTLDEILRRMAMRGNSQEFIDQTRENFEKFRVLNRQENKSVVHYEFGVDEYLEDIIKKFGYKL